MANCINLQLLIVISKTSIILDMHHHKTYMHINFQQNRVSRSVKTVHTNLFAKKLAIRILKNHAFRTCTYPLTDIQADFEINRHVRYQNTAKRNYFHRRTDGRTDERHDGQTDRQTSRTTTICSFFEEKKTTKK